MSERAQLALIQLGGFFAVVLAGAVACWAAERQPILATALASAVSWYVGKLLGKPIERVTVASVDRLEPEQAARIVSRIASAPPARLEAINRSLPPDRAIVFVDTQLPPPPAAPKARSDAPPA